MTSPTNPATTTGSSTPATTAEKQDEPETTTYTIKKVNTGLIGDHVRENVEVDGKSYGPGDDVELTEVAYESLKDAGVKFESKE